MDSFDLIEKASDLVAERRLWDGQCEWWYDAYIMALADIICITTNEAQPLDYVASIKRIANKKYEEKRQERAWDIGKILEEYGE